MTQKTLEKTRDNKSGPQTLFDKIWARHLVTQEASETPAILYIDTHLIHEVTSPQAFAMLNERGLKVARADKTFATMDHTTPTSPPGRDGSYQFSGARERDQVEQLKKNCKRHAIPLFELGDPRQGIVHVIGPELGISQPGQTIVCGDSHTSTHGAFGALAFGVGSSEVGYVLATQCLPQRKPGSFGIRVDGKLRAGVSAKDLILAIISKIGIAGATGHVIEYFGEGVQALCMEQRMTLCNMSIEAGARAGLVAPDKKTFDYLRGREFSPPEGVQWQRATTDWAQLFTDHESAFDKLVVIDADKVTPMITYGTNPEMAIPIKSNIPDKAAPDALDYMGFQAGQPIQNTPVDVVFIGSCTNSRISDLREAAQILKRFSVASGVRTLIVPGSAQVKRQAEQEGLDKIFINAGAQWREPGCSMCLGMNGDVIQAGQICVSTSNRNFEGRQGEGGRTLLASPKTAAAAAVCGKVVDPAKLEATQTCVQ